MGWTDGRLTKAHAHTDKALTGPHGGRLVHHAGFAKLWAPPLMYRVRDRVPPGTQAERTSGSARNSESRRPSQIRDCTRSDPVHAMTLFPLAADSGAAGDGERQAAKQAPHPCAPALRPPLSHTSASVSASAELREWRRADEDGFHPGPPLFLVRPVR